MSKKNQPLLSKRRRQREFDLQKPNQAKEDHAKKSKFRIDGSDKKRKGAGSFKVGKKKVKTKLSALAKAKATQAMEVDK